MTLTPERLAALRALNEERDLYSNEANELLDALQAAQAELQAWKDLDDRHLEQIGELADERNAAQARLGALEAVAVAARRWMQSDEFETDETYEKFPEEDWDPDALALRDALSALDTGPAPEPSTK